jgi:hypothetical protein
MENTVCIFIAATSGPGGANVANSAIRDIYGYTDTFIKLGVNENNIHIISDLDINSKYWNKNLNKYKIYNNINVLKELINIPMKSYIITISGHGYLDQFVYTIFNSYKVSSLILTSYIRCLPESSSALIIGDTCHSELLFDVQTIRHPKINYISACSNTQMSVQGCSEIYGYNGGLTSCVLDYINKYKYININSLYNYCKDKLILVDQHVQWKKSY